MTEHCSAQVELLPENFIAMGLSTGLCVAMALYPRDDVPISLAALLGGIAWAAVAFVASA